MMKMKMMMMTTAVMMMMNNDDDEEEDTCQGLRHICLQRESKLCSPSRDLLYRAEMIILVIMVVMLVVMMIIKVTIID